MTPKSESPNIYQRIHNVMKDVTTIKKEDRKVNNQYTFVSHDEVTRVMHEQFVKHGIVMIPTVIECIENSYADTLSTGKSVLICKTSVKIDVAFINIDNPIDKICVQFPGMGIDNQDKGIGKAISYAVKYALLKTFCLETSDDVEKDNIDSKPKSQTLTPTIDKKPEDQKIDPLQAAHLKNLVNQSHTHGHTEEFFKNEMIKVFKVKEYEDLMQNQFNQMMDFIRSEQAKRSKAS
jgi:hypothetical protein